MTKRSSLQNSDSSVRPKNMLKERGIKSCIKKAKYTLEKEIGVAIRNYSGKPIFQWFCFSVERYERHHQLQDTIPQHSGESTTGRRSEWVILQVWKNTLHTPCNPHLPHTFTADKRRWRAPGLQKDQEKEGTRPRRCVPCLSEILCWPTGPHLHTALQQVTGAVRSLLMLQTLHHGLNDYRPVALMSVAIKSFERLVLAYLKASGGPWLDPLQFAYRANRSVDDAVNMGLHFILQHLDRPGTYARILFVDFSSAFNTIIPDTLQNKLTQLSVPTSVCQWINSFLSDRQQLVRLGKFSSSTRTISTGAPQGCVLSPLLLSLYTNDCTSKAPLSSSWSLQMTPHWSASSRTVTSLLTDRRLRSWLSGAVLTTWSLTCSKLWRWSWTSGETPLHSPHSPSWTTLWLQWSHSDYWAPQFLRTWSGTITLSPLWKRPSRGNILFASWEISTCHTSCWNSSTLPSLNPSTARQLGV